MRIYTGSYDNCKTGNLISISFDEGKSAGYNGECYLKLAPEKNFWREWKNNIGVLSEEENNSQYKRTENKHTKLSTLRHHTVRNMCSKETPGYGIRPIAGS